MTVRPATASITWLFVPGDRPDRFEKALAAKPDQVIIDLEDSVATVAKSQARNAATQWLASGGNAWVRVNGDDTQWHEDDLRAIASASGLMGVVVPKAEDPSRLTALAGRCSPDTPLIALIETARGGANLGPIAECQAVTRLAFGAVDFSLDIGSDEADVPLLFARSSLVVASRAAGKPSPIDSVTTDLSAEAAAQDARDARSLGFGGKLCVHPTQVGAVERAFSPTEQELAWARAVMATTSASVGATATGGRMLDRPVVERARRIIARWGP